MSQSFRPTWEYQFVTFEKADKGWCPFMVNGMRVKEWRTPELLPTMYEYTNYLGREGWELVSYASVINPPSSQSYTFSSANSPSSGMQQMEAVFKRFKR